MKRFLEALRFRNTRGRTSDEHKENADSLEINWSNFQWPLRSLGFLHFDLEELKKKRGPVLHHIVASAYTWWKFVMFCLLLNFFSVIVLISGGGRVYGGSNVFLSIFWFFLQGGLCLASVYCLYRGSAGPSTAFASRAILLSFLSLFVCILFFIFHFGNVNGWATYVSSHLRRSIRRRMGRSTVSYWRATTAIESLCWMVAFLWGIRVLFLPAIQLYLPHKSKYEAMYTVQAESVSMAKPSSAPFLHTDGSSTSASGSAAASKLGTPVISNGPMSTSVSTSTSTHNASNVHASIHTPTSSGPASVPNTSTTTPNQSGTQTPTKTPTRNSYAASNPAPPPATIASLLTVPQGVQTDGDSLVSVPGSVLGEPAVEPTHEPTHESADASEPSIIPSTLLPRTLHVSNALLEEPSSSDEEPSMSLNEAHTTVPVTGISTHVDSDMFPSEYSIDRALSMEENQSQSDNSVHSHPITVSETSSAHPDSIASDRSVTPPSAAPAGSDDASSLFSRQDSTVTVAVSMAVSMAVSIPAAAAAANTSELGSPQPGPPMLPNESLDPTTEEEDSRERTLAELNVSGASAIRGDEGVDEVDEECPTEPNGYLGGYMSSAASTPAKHTNTMESSRIIPPLTPWNMSNVSMISASLHVSSDTVLVEDEPSLHALSDEE